MSNWSMRWRGCRLPRHGRHEYGQNFLHDRGVIDTIVETVACTDGPILEVGAGDGALTLPLQRLGRPLTAIEVDAGRAARLARRASASTRVVDADFLHYRLPRAPHVVVGATNDDRAVVAMVRIRLGATGFRRFVPAEAKCRRRPDDGAPTVRPDGR